MREPRSARVTTPTMAAGAAPSAASNRRGWIAHVVALLVAALLVVFVISQSDLAALVQGWTFLFFLIITLAVGWIIAWKRPANPLGWLILAVPALFVSLNPVAALGYQLVDSAPGAAAWLLWYGGERDNTWTWIPPIALLFTQIPLRFPNGHLPSRRWRWFFWYSIGALSIACFLISTDAVEVAPGVPNPLHLPIFGDLGSWIVIVLGLVLVCLVGSIASLFVRYRGGSSRERAQLRWIFWATFLVIVVWAVSVFQPDSDFLNAVVVLFYSLIPVSILIAVLRYRLYDIDRIISRTASYAIVTIVVVGLYALVVVGISAILPNLPSVAVAFATLAAAALFLPVLRFVQRVVDRRFDRARYNAQRVVDGFGERLRNGADPHTAAVDLGNAVEETLQPSAMGLWVAR